MTATGEYADTLRALGRFLEMVRASSIRIQDESDHMDVAWEGQGSSREERRYEECELQALRTTVRMFRGIDGGTPPVTLSELLRTIGREMDEAGATAVGIEQTADGFLVSGRCGNERHSHHCSVGDVVARARSLHADRFQKGILVRDPLAAVPSASAGALSGKDLPDVLRHRSLAGFRGVGGSYRARATSPA